MKVKPILHTNSVPNIIQLCILIGQLLNTKVSWSFFSNYT